MSDIDNKTKNLENLSIVGNTNCSKFKRVEMWGAKPLTILQFWLWKISHFNQFLNFHLFGFVINIRQNVGILAKFENFQISKNEPNNFKIWRRRLNVEHENQETENSGYFWVWKIGEDAWDTKSVFGNARIEISWDSKISTIRIWLCIFKSIFPSQNPLFLHEWNGSG